MVVCVLLTCPHFQLRLNRMTCGVSALRTLLHYSTFWQQLCAMQHSFIPGDQTCHNNLSNHYLVNHSSFRQNPTDYCFMQDCIRLLGHCSLSHHLIHTYMRDSQYSCVVDHHSYMYTSVFWLTIIKTTGILGELKYNLMKGYELDEATQFSTFSSAGTYILTSVCTTCL